VIGGRSAGVRSIVGVADVAALLVGAAAVAAIAAEAVGLYRAAGRGGMARDAADPIEIDPVAE